MKNTGKYADILYLPHHISTRHAPMSRRDRAAQFAPFAALTGYDATIRETARLTDERIELDESSQEELNEKLQRIWSEIASCPKITVTCFAKDERKAGGAYVTVTGRVKKFDTYRREIILQNETVVPVDNIYEMSIE